MKITLYPKLAFDSIKKNRRLYFPFILTCIGMVMMYYIVSFIQFSDALSYLPGSAVIYTTIQLGGWVITVFSAIFLFYTNTFLLKQRKKEFGLYNILGMGKNNIIQILFWELLIIAAISLSVGLIFGVAFSKLAELALLYIVHADVTYSFSVSLDSIYETLLVYGAVFLLLFLNAVFQIKLSSTISLLNSEKAGEKPPKGNFLFAVIGLLLLGGAYYISYTIEDPVSALITFFIAVVMVIIGTYLIMIAGSVFFCKLLQKNDNYYYKTNHFISVSSMVYRMKRNGAGLASICILATMVLVMLSSTTSLYFGNEDALNSRYPRELDLTFYAESVDVLTEENIDRLDQIVLEVCEDYKTKPTNFYRYRNAVITGYISGDVAETNPVVFDNLSLDQLDDLITFHFIPVSDFNTLTGRNEVLQGNDVIIYTYRTNYDNNTLSFNGAETFNIVDRLDSFEINGQAAMEITPAMFIIVPDFVQNLSQLSQLSGTSGSPLLLYRYMDDFDVNLAPEQQIELFDSLYERVENENLIETLGFSGYNFESREEARQSFFTLTGGLFFLGALLSLVFICAAVLIIYYKQISEGYEDQSRFEIMQKVGLTKEEIRKSINSQLLTVFFFPLILAAIHMMFAFPIVQKLLLLFNLNNVMLFALSTICCVLIFGLFYSIIYKVTSNAYYKIVSGVE